MIKYKNFNIYNEGNELVVLNTESKQIKRKIVEDNHEFTFKVMKTKIKAIGGINGLLNFIQNCINNDFRTCWINNIIKGM